MRKPTFCMCENKGADQLRSNCTAVQHLCFRYTDCTINSTTFLNQNFLLLSIFCACVARFVSDLFGNHIVCFLKTRLKSPGKLIREMHTPLNPTFIYTLATFSTNLPQFWGSHFRFISTALAVKLASV